MYFVDFCHPGARLLSFLKIPSSFNKRLAQSFGRSSIFKLPLEKKNGRRCPIKNSKRSLFSLVRNTVPLLKTKTNIRDLGSFQLSYHHYEGWEWSAGTRIVLPGNRGRFGDWVCWVSRCRMTGVETTLTTSLCQREKENILGLEICRVCPRFQNRSFSGVHVFYVGLPKQSQHLEQVKWALSQEKVVCANTSRTDEGVYFFPPFLLHSEWMLIEMNVNPLKIWVQSVQMWTQHNVYIQSKHATDTTITFISP